MHELLLFGQIPSARHPQTLHILAGIAATQPIPVLETHLVFKPNRPPGAVARPPAASSAAGNPQLQALQAQTQGDLFYLQVVCDGGVEERGVGMEKSQDLAIDGTGAEGESARAWTLRFRDLPEVTGRRPLTSRLMADVQFTSGDPLQFMAAMDYTHTSTYILTGHRFTHLSTSLLLSRALIPSPTPFPTTLNPHSLATNARLVDPSGAYVLQAALRVQDGSKPELMTKGIAELLSVKEALKGVVEMVVGDRLSLDTRWR